MAEAERRPVGHEHAPRHRLLDVGRTLGNDGLEHIGGDARPDHRRGVDDRTGAHAEPPRTRERRVAHRLGEASAGGDRLDDEERIPARDAGERGAVEAGRLRELANRVLGERSQRDPPGEGRRREVADQAREIGVGGELIVAIGDEQRDPHVLEAPCEQPQHVDGGGVRPVRVLDHRQHRRPLREGAQQGAREREAVTVVAQRHARRLGQLAQRCQRHGNRQRLAGARDERSLRPVACARSARTSEVFPIPASPPTRTIAPRPPTAPSTTAASADSSSSRSSSESTRRC